MSISPFQYVYYMHRKQKSKIKHNANYNKQVINGKTHCFKSEKEKATQQKNNITIIIEVSHRDRSFC